MTKLVRKSMNRLRAKWLKITLAIAIGIISVVILDIFKADLSLAGDRLITAQTTPEAISTESMSDNFNLFQAVILGMVQGLTEFIPISSTAHLKAVPEFLGWGDPGITFTAVIQLGSIFAVFWYYREKLIQLLNGTFKAVQSSNYQSQDFRISLGIVVGTFPIAIVGLLLKFSGVYTDDSPLRSMSAIAIASIVMALLLAIAEYIGKRKREFENLNTKDGILMGVAQTLALIPGVSRSGSTITAGLFINLQRSTAGDFSFLLGIPAITLAGLVELKDAFDQQIPSNEWLNLGVGVISATIFSYLAIAWLINYLKKHNTWVFIVYRLAFGLFIIGAISRGMQF